MKNFTKKLNLLFNLKIGYAMISGFLLQTTFLFAQPCAVTITGNTTITAGSSTTLTAILNSSCGLNSMYWWSNGATTNAIVVSPADSMTQYCVTGYCPADSCWDSICVTVYIPASPCQASGSMTHVSCGTGNDGVACVTSIGVAPYTYMWGNGATVNCISGLSIGNYSVVVTDSTGCSSTTTAYVLPPIGLQVSTTAVPVSCSPGNDGVACATSAGTSPYTYLWSNGATDNCISGLSMGTYTVSITDANGCIGTAIASITQDSSNLSASVQTNGGAGTATVTGFGGVTPYAYSWNTNPIQNTQTATGLTPGSYVVCVTDANGCTSCVTFLMGHSSCSNRDFEDGDFTNYIGETGDNNNGGNANITWTGGLVQGANDASVYSTNRHTFHTINTLDPLTIDPFTGQPDTYMTTLAPNGGNFTVRLGNAINGFGAEGLKTTFAVTSTDTVFTYQFAGVYEDPAHQLVEQPGFMVNIYDQNGVKDANLSEVIYSRDPTYPFIVSTSGPNGSPIVYRRWQGLSINLSAHVGNTVTIEFVNFDCALGGHMGYTYIDGSCFGSLIANVWPGDCDYDLTANNVDLLSLGLAYGATGPVRVGASTNWSAQPSNDWAQSFTLGANYKHSDCNGDGIVDLNDALVVAANYGNVHPFRLQQPVYNEALADMYLTSTSDSVGPNSIVSVDIMLGKSNLPVDSIYAIAFSVTYDPAFVSSTFNVAGNFSNSWLGTAGNNMITLDKNQHSSGQINMALARTNHSNMVGGVGKIGTLTFQTSAALTAGNIPLTIAGVKAITATGRVISLNTVGNNIFFDPNISGVTEYLSSDLVSVYPNPATDVMSVAIPAEFQNGKIELINTIGQTVVKSAASATTKLDVSTLPSGMYQMKISCDQGTMMKRVQVINK